MVEKDFKKDPMEYGNYICQKNMIIRNLTFLINQSNN